MVDWIYKHRPQSIDEMALYPALRKRLKYYASQTDFSHLLMAGDTGTGKTTAARILADLHGFDVIEHDCAQEQKREDMLKLAKGSTSVSLWGGRKLYIMDEFHDVPKQAQKVFNKTMEDNAERNLYVFCVNDVTAVAEPIISRCMSLYFDVGVINPKTNKLAMHDYTEMSKDEWVDELKRIGRLVAKKGDMEVSDAQLDKVASVDVYLADPRRFIRALEEQIKMDAVEN